MFEAIPDMIRFCRKDEKKKVTSQIGLFDESEEYEETLELQDIAEFSYEEILR